MSEKITAMIEEIKALTVLELSELVKAIEEEFNIKFVNDDFAEIKTINDVIKIIEKKVS